MTMVKKSKENVIDSFMNSIKSKFIVDTAKNVFAGLLDSVSDATEKLVDRMAKFIGSSIFFIAGVLFLLLGVVFLFRQYLDLSYGWSFSLIGLVLVVISFVIKSGIER